MAEKPLPNPPAEPSGRGDRFGFLTRKLGPLPVWAYAVIIMGVYYWYMHYGPGKSTSSQARNAPYGLDANGNPIIPMATESISQSGGPDSSSSSSTTTTTSPPPKTNPPPKPKPKKPKPQPSSNEVTVAKWPGTSSNGLAQWNTTLWGIAQHEHTTVAELQRLNPQVKNPSLVYPGEKIKVPGQTAHERPSHTQRKVPVDTGPVAGSSTKKVLTTTVNNGRWQNSETISVPVTGQTQDSQDQTTGQTVTDVIEHRPLGM